MILKDLMRIPQDYEMILEEFFMEQEITFR